MKRPLSIFTYFLALALSLGTKACQGTFLQKLTSVRQSTVTPVLDLQRQSCVLIEVAPSS